MFSSIQSSMPLTDTYNLQFAYWIYIGELKKYSSKNQVPFCFVTIILFELAAFLIFFFKRQSLTNDNILWDRNEKETLTLFSDLVVFIDEFLYLVLIWSRNTLVKWIKCFRHARKKFSGLLAYTSLLDKSEINTRLHLTFQCFLIFVYQLP